MSYNIQSQILPNRQMMLYESQSGSSVILENRSNNLYMVYCDTGNSKAIEYPLLEEFLKLPHWSSNLLNTLKNRNNLKGKWHKAKIFTVQGFLHFINTGRSDDDLRKDFNNFIKHCVFAADGYFKWPHTNFYPGKGLFNPTKELLQIGVFAAMGYHVGHKGLNASSRHNILQVAFTNAVPFVEIDNMKEWNAPRTPWRFKKIASCLATFTKNAKRRSNSDSFWQALKGLKNDAERIEALTEWCTNAEWFDKAKALYNIGKDENS